MVRYCFLGFDFENEVHNLTHTNPETNRQQHGRIMLHCISLHSSSPSPTTNNVNSRPDRSQGNSTDGTPQSSTRASPIVSFTREYTQAVQTSSYNEMWTRIHVFDPSEDGQAEHDHVQECQEQVLQLDQVLQPNRQSVADALSLARPNKLTRLVSSYFDHSENTSHLCIILHQSVHRASELYRPLYRVFDVLPNEGQLSQSQCDMAFNVFVEFDTFDNPFPCPDSQNFSEVRSCFAMLRQQLDRRLTKFRSRTRLIRNVAIGSSICLVGVALSVVVVTTHGFGLLAAAPLCAGCVNPNFGNKGIAHVAQLDAAAKGTYVLNNDLDTIDRLVARLYNAVESDKLLIRLGLERGREKHPMQEVLKQLRKNHVNFLDQLKDLEEHICLCFSTVNRTRSLLLREISIHQSSMS